MKTSKLTASIALVGTTLLSLSACTAQSLEDTDEVLVDVDEDISTAAYTDPNGCPKASEAPTAQANATAIVRYLVGGPSPFTKSPGQPGFGECFGVKTNVDNIKSFVASGMCTLTAPTAASQVCGLAASKYTLRCGGASALDFMRAATGYMDKCFSPGTAHYFFPGAQDNYTMFMDPEPARTTQALTGSNGATAAAVYVNSAIATKVVRWPTSPTPGTVAPGTPCSPTDLAAGSATLRLIQASGSYRKCY